MAVLIEPFAGSLAVSLFSLGLPHLVGWQGGKSGYARHIHEALAIGTPHEIWCADVNEWGTVWRALARPGVAQDAARWLSALRERERPASCTQGDRRIFCEIWHELRDHWRAHGIEETGAGVGRWLALIKGSAMTRGPSAGCAEVAAPGWRPDSRAPGRCIQRSLTYGVAEKLATYPALPVRVWGDAREIPLRTDALVYLDPPYAGTTGYGKSAAFDVDALIRDWTRAGARVALSSHRERPDAADTFDLTARRRGAGRVFGATSELLHVF